jgi:hypothetical protein
VKNLRFRERKAFEAWGGPCRRAGVNACTLFVAGGSEIWAAFRQAVPASGLQTLTVSSGGVDLISVPGGIDCGSSGSKCQASFPSGTLVTLRASAIPDEWGGACNGEGETCALVVDASTSVVARVFWTSPAPRTVGINVSVSGRGAVSAISSGTNRTVVPSRNVTWQTALVAPQLSRFGSLTIAPGPVTISDTYARRRTKTARTAVGRSSADEARWRRTDTGAFPPREPEEAAW